MVTWASWHPAWHIRGTRFNNEVTVVSLDCRCAVTTSSGRTRILAMAAEAAGIREQVCTTGSLPRAHRHRLISTTRHDISQVGKSAWGFTGDKPEVLRPVRFLSQGDMPQRQSSDATRVWRNPSPFFLYWLHISSFLNVLSTSQPSRFAGETPGELCLLVVKPRIAELWVDLRILHSGGPPFIFVLEVYRHITTIQEKKFKWHVILPP